MMKVSVLMLANQPNAGVVREVEIPDDTPDEAVLDAVFHFGQNDFQPIPKIVSVSMGDVIIKNETPHLIMAGGFRKLSLVELRAYIEKPRVDRVISAWKVSVSHRDTDTRQQESTATSNQRNET